MSDCCKVKGETPQGESCPQCHARGKSVPDETPRALLEESSRRRLGARPYFYCRTPTCDVVYFDGAGDVFRKDELRVRVGDKETSPPIPVCYCFGHTVGSIEEEILSTGTTNVLERIRAEVKAGTCRCEVENPQGSCCLGNVTRAVQSLLGVHPRTARTGTGGS